MFLFAPTVFFFLGAVVGSFIGVLVARLHTGEGFLSGRSRCDACNALLLPRSLIPVVSYFLAGGRARCCDARLSPGAPLTELLLGGLFTLSYLSIGPTGALPLLLFSLSLLLALVLYDAAHQIPPPVLLALFVCVSALSGYALAPSLAAFSSTLPVAFLIGGSLALAHLLSRGRAMGFSDAPLAVGLALLTGPAALPGFLFSFWVGAVVGIVVLVRRPRGSRIGVEVPFAPFLAVGFLLAYFTQWNPFIFVAALQ